MSKLLKDPNFRLPLLVMLLGVALMAFAVIGGRQAMDDVTLSQTFDDSEGIRFDYPDGWRYTIPETNIIFLADPDVLNQQPGASMTIQRALRLSTETDTLRDGIDLFLRRGPLAAGRDWTLVEAAQPSQVDGREALTAVLEGAEGEDAPRLHSEVTITQADNGFFYVFALTAPLDDWPTVQPIFAAILESVTILE